MAKNILIFSDGTGQAGGLVPDEVESNVYKLYRASRCGPLSTIDPAAQVAFYDPGLGSASDGADIKIGWMRKVYNLLAGATGLGITRNIVDCYAAILRVWEPGDRIYLFGFSRGAYTVRCVSGVLGYCGVPTIKADGSPLGRDPAVIAAIAEEAVKQVYQHGSTVPRDDEEGSRRAAVERKERARRFRETYGSGTPERANAVPYFIGVWDTVKSLGLGPRFWPVVIGALAGALGLGVVLAAVAALVVLGLGVAAGSTLFLSLLFGPLALLVTVGVLGYAGLLVASGFTFDIRRYRMTFYNTNLTEGVPYARHALSIDENRSDFQREPWHRNAAMAVAEGTTPEPFVQLWFAGVHSDIGGSYTENESRLSDHALAWMVGEVRSLPHPVALDERFLYRWPDAAGIQHDERKAAVSEADWFMRLLRGLFGRDFGVWPAGVRTVPPDAPLHSSVLERFAARSVVHYDVAKPYRPENLSGHEAVARYYRPGGASGATSDAAP